MSKREIIVHDMNDILPKINEYIARYEINISEMSKNTGIPRSTLYDFLFSDCKALEKVQKMLEYLELEVSIKPSSER